MKKERLYFLRRMNAWTPPQEPPPAARPVGEAPAVARGSRQPATRMVQGEGRRYRLRYTKLGRIAYLGHLDLIRHLPRIFRRAGLEVFYSSGFHPKPELSFGPALGLGIPSLAEVLDVKLVGEIEPAELLARLNAVTLDGVEFLGATTLGDNDRALGRVLARAVFAARLSPAEVTSALVDFAEGKPLSVLRPPAPGKGSIGRRVDVRRSLARLAPPDDEQAAGLAAGLGWAREETLTYAVTISTEGSARPAEVVEALLGPEAAARAELARISLEAAEVLDPLDTGALRAAFRPPAVASA
jgi:radical SAM-linked protein